jgi:hypothetical protein
MTEEPSVVELLMYAIKLGTIIGTGIFFIWLFVNMRPIVETHSTDRAANQIAEQLSSSNDLTNFKAVFDAVKLDSKMATIIQITNKNYEIDNARICSFDYHVKFERISDAKIWEFGYLPYQSLTISQATKSYEISFADTSDPDTVVPGILTITAYDTWLSRISCLAEQAFYDKQIKIMQIPCIKPLIADPIDGKYICRFPIRKSGGFLASEHTCLYNNIAISNQNDINCRYQKGIPIETSYLKYKDTSNSHSLKALPIKTSSNLASILGRYDGDNEKKCATIEELAKDDMPLQGDNVGAIIYCVD